MNKNIRYLVFIVIILILAGYLFFKPGAKTPQDQFSSSALPSNGLVGETTSERAAHPNNPGGQPVPTLSEQAAPMPASSAIPAIPTTPAPTPAAVAPSAPAPMAAGSGAIPAPVPAPANTATTAPAPAASGAPAEPVPYDATKDPLATMVGPNGPNSNSATTAPVNNAPIVGGNLPGEDAPSPAPGTISAGIPPSNAPIVPPTAPIPNNTLINVGSGTTTPVPVNGGTPTTGNVPATTGNGVAVPPGEGQ